MGGSVCCGAGGKSHARFTMKIKSLKHQKRDSAFENNHNLFFFGASEGDELIEESPHLDQIDRKTTHNAILPMPQRKNHAKSRRTTPILEIYSKPKAEQSGETAQPTRQVSSIRLDDTPSAISVCELLTERGNDGILLIERLL
jgi:hypothetical protein